MNSGFLLIDKKEGWTSRDVCNKIQHIFNVKKVGHSGTLDPFATGLLIVGIGNATKALSFLEDFTKEYIAVIKLGKKTDTGDVTGNFIDTKPISDFSNNDLNVLSNSLLGKSMQIPPMTSAIKVNGKKLYELAHKGIEINREPREIEIFEMNMIKSNVDEIILKTHVSKGTYIRTLGEDIAEKLNNVGYLLSLRRTKINSIRVEDAKSLETINEKDIKSISDVLSSFMEVIKVDDETVIKIKNGMKLNKDISLKKSNNILLVDNANNALAVYTKSMNGYLCKRGLW